MIEQLVQIAGAVMVLAGYALSQAGRLDQNSRTYLWLNFVGSAVLAVLAGIGRQWGFLLLEGAWALVSAAGLARRARQRLRGVPEGGR